MLRTDQRRHLENEHFKTSGGQLGNSPFLFRFTHGTAVITSGVLIVIQAARSLQKTTTKIDAIDLK
ncbi:hypothetical protein JZ751_015494 [Albula glossodonta]|uniref:Uncharacterized protein n=1 Tax=Albula glossodonta TaxID=121402 RepID=A0A8T2MWZ4_9TELE|nr:hypothetical protein JZ751_015494 [Albula glossodonta]